MRAVRNHVLRGSGAAPVEQDFRRQGVGQDHRELIRREFTRQAETYSANASISDPDRIARLVRAVAPGPDDRALEVASGPGYVALAFADICREVVGVDLTEAQLRVAERNRAALGIGNARFVPGDAEALPFEDQEFDVVVCRFAVHHFPRPAHVVAEMARVCREGGSVAVEDLITSEHPDRSEYQNRFERLRDPSHVRALPLTGLVGTLADAGLEVTQVYTDHLLPEVEEWLENAHPPPEAAARVRELVERDALEDLSGATPHRHEGRLRFVQRTVTVVARKLPARS